VTSLTPASVALTVWTIPRRENMLKQIADSGARQRMQIENQYAAWLSRHG